MSNPPGNGTTPPALPPMRKRPVTFSIGDDVDEALRALYPNDRSRWLDALLREQPAIREWLAQHAGTKETGQ